MSGGWESLYDRRGRDARLQVPRVRLRPFTPAVPAAMEKCPIKSQDIGHYLIINGQPAICKCPPAVEPTTEEPTTEKEN